MLPTDRLFAGFPGSPPSLRRPLERRGGLGRYLLATAVACAALGCEENLAPELQPPPASVSVASGDGQIGEVGQELAHPLVVRVTDSNNAPIEGVDVAFVVTSGGGLIEPATRGTDVAGRAQAAWTLGTSVQQPQRAEARVAVGGMHLIAAFEAEPVPGAAAVVEVTAPAATLLVGMAVPLSTAVQDGFGNPIAEPVLSWSSAPPGIVSLSPAGEATGLAPGTATVTASSGSASGFVLLVVARRPIAPSDISFSLGTPEVVFSYRSDRCELMDLPDMTARAVRMPDGSIALYSGNAPRAYASFGPDFHSLSRSCLPTLVSDDDITAPTFSNQEWLSTVYREGGVFHAIVHNEYHDPVHPNCKQGDTSPANPCWYNALTHASSLDGRVFSQPTAPGHVIAGPPQTWDPSGARAPGPYGYFAPSNIVRRDDGFYYAMFFTIPDRDDPQRRGSCVMRTDDLADPTSWRAWDGAAFALAMPSPYAEHATGIACTIVFPHGLDGSLTYNTFLERYLYVGATGANIGGTVKCGFLFAISDDLINWSAPAVLKEAPVPFPPCGSGPNIGREYYPSIIDHDDTSINFENSGRTPHLYYMRYNDNALDRDLVRVPVTIGVR